ncbi:RHS repeat-associated core domain-containing protein [Pseudomonas sp. NFX15]|uniref:RHS repeat-associated core domain-containing protein n=1 Tax=Pseudomonas sp. NFX15 TaxID=2816958 RepID=UPI003B8D014A
MSQAKPDVPIRRSKPRVVLLAADRNQSIIGEIVDGQTKTIAYSAYGEQSAQQKVETRLGFNGQMREADIGWYLLGNGYRAYNPRLMRFHSPDSWSPFGGGGLNAYMYCVGDPVNRVDPTGHVPWVEPWFKKLAGNVFKFIFGGSDVTGPNRTRALQATVSTGRRMSVEHVDLAAMSNIAGEVLVKAPRVKPKGLYPPNEGIGRTTPYNHSTPTYHLASTVPSRPTTRPTSNAPRQSGNTTSHEPPPAPSQSTSDSKPAAPQIVKMEASLPIYQAQLAPAPPSYEDAMGVRKK